MWFVTNTTSSYRANGYERDDGVNFLCDGGGWRSLKPVNAVKSSINCHQYLQFYRLERDLHFYLFVKKAPKRTKPNKNNLALSVLSALRTTSYVGMEFISWHSKKMRFLAARLLFYSAHKKGNKFCQLNALNYILWAAHHINRTLPRGSVQVFTYEMSLRLKNLFWGLILFFLSAANHHWLLDGFNK